MEKYIFYGLDINNDVKVKVETEDLYTPESAWSMNFKLQQMFPGLTFDYQSS